MADMDHRPIPHHWHTGLTARGFTAIELLTVIAILAILAAIAAPSFTPLIERWRVRQVSEALQSTLYLARSEAIKHGGDIIVKKNDNEDPGGCALASQKKDWGCGWTVFLDVNNNDKQDNNEPTIQTYPGTLGTEVTNNNGGTYFKIDRYGLGSLGPRSFTIFPHKTGKSSSATRTICITSGGRIRTVEASSCS